MRYHVIMVRPPGNDVALRVFDHNLSRVLLDWKGAVVRHLVESGALPTELCKNGCYACDKSFVWHLILAGAATQMALDQIGVLQSGLNKVLRKQLSCPTSMAIGKRKNHQTPSAALADRLDELGIQLTAPHKFLAKMLFAHPGHHFSEQDVCCLLRLKFPPLVLPDHRVTACLDDLARWRVIQRIEVDTQNIFYDIITTPHLHLYDSRTRELRDADAEGIIHVSHDSIETTVQLTQGSSAVIPSHAN